MTLELPGREPITGVHLVFVSNVDPWTYYGKRPVRTNPGTSMSTGLGVFALTSMGLPVALRASAQILTGRRAGPRHIIRAKDEKWVTVALQRTGRHAGRW